MSNQKELIDKDYVENISCSDWNCLQNALYYRAYLAHVNNYSAVIVAECSPYKTDTYDTHPQLLVPHLCNLDYSNNYNDDINKAISLLKEIVVREIHCFHCFVFTSDSTLKRSYISPDGDVHEAKEEPYVIRDGYIYNK